MLLPYDINLIWYTTTSWIDNKWLFKNYRETHRQVEREKERGTEKDSKCKNRYENVKKMSHLYFGQKDRKSKILIDRQTEMVKWDNTYIQTGRNGKMRLFL